MKWGIGLIIFGTIFLWDGIMQLVIIGNLTANPMLVGSSFIKFGISSILLFFGIKRLYSKGQRERQD